MEVRLGTAGLYGAVYLLRDFLPVYPFFFERGAIQPLNTFLFFVAVACLFQRARWLRRESLDDEDMEALVPSEAIQTEEILARLDRPPQTGGSHLLSRIWSILRASLGGEGPSLAQARLSKRDRERLDKAYALPARINTSIPMFGFLGTLVGISQALAVWSQTGRAAQSLEEMKGAIRSFGAGLDTAFSTTIWGLILALGLALLLALVRQREEALLDRIDSFIEERLLPALQRRGSPAEAWEAVMRLVMSQHLPRFEQALQQIQARMLQRLEEGMSAWMTRSLERQAAATQTLLEAIRDREEVLTRELSQTVVEAIQASLDRWTPVQRTASYVPVDRRAS